MTFYNADGTAFTTLSAASSTNQYIACYNSSGYGVWVAYLAGNIATVNNDKAIAVNLSTETIYCVTCTQATLTMHNASGTTFATHTLIGGVDAVYCAYNSTGTGLWLSAAANTSCDTFIPSVAVNQNSGNVYFTGSYGVATLKFYNPGAVLSSVSLTLLGQAPQYVAAYNSLGYVQWAAKIDNASGTYMINSCGVCVNNITGNVYTGGKFYNGEPGTLYNSSGSSSGITITSAGSAAFVIIAAYNSAGTVQWGTQIAYTSASDNSYFNSMGINSTTGSVFIGGFFGASTSIYNSGGSIFTTLSSGSSFIAAYNSAGTAFWATSMSASLYSLYVNPILNTVHVTGAFGGASAFYNSDTTTFGTLSGTGTVDCFTIVYDNLVTNYQLLNTGSDPTTKTLLFQNNATLKGVIVVLPQGNAMYSTSGKVVYRLYFTTTGNKVALIWTNGAWTIQGNLNVPVITA